VTGTAWEVQAVRYGTYPNTKAGLMLQYAHYGEPDAPQALDYYLYVLRGDGRTVVIDTGFATAEADVRGRTTLVDPAALLPALGADLLVLTHLHWDHIGNVDALAGCPVVAPRTELDFWRSPVARHPPFWAHTHAPGLDAVQAAVEAGRVEPFAGVARLAPGLTAFEIGGHSPGQVILLVQTAEGHVVLCSDAVHLYEELALRRPFAVVDDLQAMFAGFDLVDALVAELGAVAVPGHDPLVAERFPAGDLGPGSVRIA
jgi:glyoxylase-like metal-dependent hydrolase (beta-lactamase superfamily II)